MPRRPIALLVAVLRLLPPGSSVVAADGSGATCADFDSYEWAQSV